MVDLSANVAMVALGSDGVETYHTEVFDPSEAAHRFHPGDKLTITF